MSNKFDIRRVGMLTRVYWANGARQNLFTLLITLGVVLAITVYITFKTESGSFNAEMPIMLLVTAFCACYGASIVSKPLGERPKCISFLMQPASQLEKFTARCLIYIVGCWAVLIAGAAIIDGARMLLEDILNQSGGDDSLFDPFRPSNWDHPVFSILMIIGTILNFQSLFVIGGMVWPRRGMVLTLAYMLAVNFMIGIFGSFCFQFLNDGDFTYNAINNIVIDIDTDTCETALKILGLILVYGATALNYTLAYFRLKEAELVQRW